MRKTLLLILAAFLPLQSDAQRPIPKNAVQVQLKPQKPVVASKAGASRPSVSAPRRALPKAKATKPFYFSRLAKGVRVRNYPWHPCEPHLDRKLEMAAAGNSFAPFPNFASKVTITAAKSGNASDPSVWNLGRALMAGDFFSVPAGIVLTWDLTSCPNLAGGYVVGTLDCGSAPGNKTMNAATVFVDSGGKFLCGSCVNNVALQGTFTLTFLDVAPDPTFDPGQFGTGFLTMGAQVDLCGAATKTAWVRCKGTAANSNQITLLETPQGWNNSDELLIPATQYSYATPQDEVLLQGTLSGNVLTLSSPLGFDHSTPVVSFNAQTWTKDTVSVTVNYTLTANSDLSVTINSTYTWKDSVSGQGGTYSGSFTWRDSYLVSPTQVSPCLYVGNLTRNIVFQSANPKGTRGHAMFMKDMAGNPTLVNACHARIKGMGRTRVDSAVTDPMVDANGVLVPGTADNPRARYSWHTHLQGPTAASDGTSSGAPARAVHVLPDDGHVPASYNGGLVYMSSGLSAANLPTGQANGWQVTLLNISGDMVVVSADADIFGQTTPSDFYNLDANTSAVFWTDGHAMLLVLGGPHVSHWPEHQGQPDVRFGLIGAPATNSLSRFPLPANCTNVSIAAFLPHSGRSRHSDSLNEGIILSFSGAISWPPHSRPRPSRISTRRSQRRPGPARCCCRASIPSTTTASKSRPARLSHTT